MPTADASIRIDRPREEVFDYATDPQQWPVWQSNIEVVSGDDVTDKGGRVEAITKVAGRKLEWTGEVAEAERPSRWVIRSVEAPFAFEFAWTYDDVDGATELRVRGEAEPLGGFFGKLADPLVAKMFERDLRANLENLKAILEEG
jgi:uncharacterized membrane protein